MTIKVINEVEICEINDDACEDDNKIIIESHYNDNERIVLVIDKKRYTVHAKDLKQAAENATKT